MDGISAEVGNAQELVVILQALLGEEDRVILCQLKEHLIDIIGDSNGLYQVLKALESNDHLFLIEILGEDVKKLLNKSEQLSKLFSFLSQPSTKSLLLKNLGSEFLRKLIYSPEELSEILEWIYEEDDVMLLKMLGEVYNRKLYHNGSELSLVLHNVSISSQEWYLRFLGLEYLSELTINWQDLAWLLRALPHSLSCIYLETLDSEKLSNLIRNQDEWEKISKFLEPEEEDYLIKRMGLNNAK
jgi:hypothetical protein